jgi:hypothetical protein
MTWVSKGTERGWTDLARDSACDGDGDDDTQTHGRPFRFGCWFFFSLSKRFSEKLLMEDDELLVEIEGKSRERECLCDCGAGLRHLSDRGCEGEAVSTVVGREWWFPMIGAVIVKLECWNDDRYLYKVPGDAGGKDPVARSNALFFA